MTLQAFKETDLKEAKVRDCALPVMTQLGQTRDTFFADAYTCFKLGEALFDSKRHPMFNVITREIFRTSFDAINTLFTRPGTFEFYLEVFRKIWGEDVAIDFEVPAPGKLLINIEANALLLSNFIARRIVDDAYIYEEVLDSDGNNIVFQGSSGIKTQQETDALMFELYPAGLWVVATLTIV